MSTHYHQPFNFTFEGLNAAKQTLDKFYNALRQNLNVKSEKTAPDDRVVAALADDLNTPLAMSYLHEDVNNLNNAETGADRTKYKSRLLADAYLLGLLWQDPESWFKGGNAAEGPDEAAVEAEIAARAEAKKAKNYALADEIRNRLKEQGIILEDGPAGTTWKRA